MAMADSFVLRPHAIGLCGPTSILPQPTILSTQYLRWGLLPLLLPHFKAVLEQGVLGTLTLHFC